MADPPDYSDTRDSGGEPGHEATASTPRWVKVFGIIALALALLVGLMLLVGGGRHGPGRHASPADAGGQTSPPSLSGFGGGHTLPPGDHAPR